MPAVAQRSPAPSYVFRTQTHAPAGSRASELRNFRVAAHRSGASADDSLFIDNVVYIRRRLKRAESLFKIGDEFKAMYTVHSGSFKTCMVDGQGHEQVSSFNMQGDILGLEGLGSGRHDVTAVALEDSEVCVLPFVALEELARDNVSVQRHLHAVLAREIARNHGTMLLLGSLGAQKRLVTFLLNLSARYKRAGYSSSDFHLRMTRDEIGSYLGLKLETISRLFSDLARDMLLEVDGKHVRIRDARGLERILKS